MRNTFIALLLLALAACGSDTSEDHIARAREYIAESAYPSAIIELKNALQQDTQSAEARWLLGKIYLDAGDVLAAEKELQRAQELGWPDDDIRPALARILLAQGKFEEALALGFQDLNPDAASQLLASQALAELSAGQYDKAGQLVELALEKAPESLTAKQVEARNLIHQGKLNKALNVINEVLEEAPQSPEAWRIKGQALLQLQRLEESREAMNQSVEHSGGALSDVATRALISLQLQDYPAAEADAATLLAISPKNPVGNFVKGLLYFQDKKYREAITALSLAEPATGNFPLVLFYLSMAHLIDGNEDRATSLAARYTELAPENINGRKLFATILIQQEKLKQARKTIQPALDFNSADVGALNIMANILLLEGEVDQGLVLYARIKQLQPDWPISPLGFAAGLVNPDLGGRPDQGVEKPRDTNPNFPQTDILIIVEHLLEEDYDAAIAAAESYKWRDLTSLSPYHVLGRVYLAAGKQIKARETFNKALNREPGDPSANLSLAHLALQKDNTSRARKYYEAALYDNTNHLATLLQLASLEAREGNEEAMARRLDQAANNHPDALVPRLRLAAYYVGSGRSRMVPQLFDMLDILQQRSPPVLELLAMSHLQQKQYAKARAALEQLVALHPRTAGHYYLMAQASEGLKQKARSSQELQTALELNPEHLPSLTAMTKLTERDENREEFEQYYARLLELAPDSSEALRMRASEAQRNGDAAEAMALSERAFSQAPSTQSVLALVNYQKAAGANRQARNTMLAWIEEQPDDVTIRLILATDLQRINNLEGAQRQYKGILKTDPNNIVALNNLAWNLRRKQPSEALKYISKALRVAPERPDLQDTMAVVLHYNNERKSAQRYIKKALRGDPDNVSMRYHQAMIEATLGNRKPAIATLQELTKLPASEFPERAEAQKLLNKLGG